MSAKYIILNVTIVISAFFAFVVHNSPTDRQEFDHSVFCVGFTLHVDDMVTKAFTGNPTINDLRLASIAIDRYHNGNNVDYDYQSILFTKYSATCPLTDSYLTFHRALNNAETASKCKCCLK